MSRKHVATIAVLSAVGLFSVVASAAYKRTGDAKMTISASLAPAGTFEGGCADAACSGLSVTEQNGNVVISIPFKSLQVGTGVLFKGRTEHMMSVFGNNRISLTVPKSELKLPEDGKSLSASATGILTLKQGGKAVKKKFDYKIKRAGKKYFVTDGKLDIDYQADFGIEKIKKMGVTVKPMVHVHHVQFTVIET
jgi:hypothetical protein